MDGSGGQPITASDLGVDRVDGLSTSYVAVCGLDHRPGIVQPVHRLAETPADLGGRIKPCHDVFVPTVHGPDTS